MKNIVLVGMPGCGKTTIGKMLAEKLSLNFIDVDSFIENESGKRIVEIFQQGEQIFRDMETRSLKKITALSGAVISTGGGVLKTKENMALIKQLGIVFYINRPIEYIYMDIDTSSRPLLKDKNTLYSLYNERKDDYKKACDHEIENTSQLEVVIQKIIHILNYDL